MIDILKLRAWSVLLGIRSIYHFSFLVFLIFIFLLGFNFKLLSDPLEYIERVGRLNYQFWPTYQQTITFLSGQSHNDSTLESSHPLCNDPLVRRDFVRNVCSLKDYARWEPISIEQDAPVISLPFSENASRKLLVKRCNLFKALFGSKLCF